MRTRAQALIDRVAHLDDEETARRRGTTLDRFGGRHRDLAGTFRHHYDLVRHRAARPGISRRQPAAGRRYFSHEYAVEAAALCNLSMVAHPDETDLGTGQLRVAVSLRQVGEGHVSSIGFATVIVGRGNSSVIAMGPGRWPSGSGRAHGTAGTCSLRPGRGGCDNEVAATVLNALPEWYDEAAFGRVLGNPPPDLLLRAPGVRHDRATASYERR